jgi:hypothetical protein
MARRVKYLTKIFIFLIKLHFITVNMAKTRNKCQDRNAILPFWSLTVYCTD